jgi:hypothetical protein
VGNPPHPLGRISCDCVAAQACLSIHKTVEFPFVPTPFQHLVYAEFVYHHPGLPLPVRRLLRDAWGSFLLGSTAGDVQVITGQARVETHFYHLDDIGIRSAVGTLLATHPHLACPQNLTANHAAFLTGYLVHLTWDEAWARDLFIPLYQDAPYWQDRRSCFLHHNALRVLLDRVAYASLDKRASLSASLRGVVPQQWLPFAEDLALLSWRDWLAEQLADPTTVQTSAVFAQRMRVPVQELEALVQQLGTGSYSQVPNWAAAVELYEARALEESIETVLRYWGIEDRLWPLVELQQACVHD